jgi:hypothetical protein
MEISHQPHSFCSFLSFCAHVTRVFFWGQGSLEGGVDFVESRIMAPTQGQASLNHQLLIRGLHCHNLSLSTPWQISNPLQDHNCVARRVVAFVMTERSMLSWCCGKIPSLGRGCASLLLPVDAETAKPAKNRRPHATHTPANSRRGYILKFRQFEIREDVNLKAKLMFWKSRRSHLRNGNTSQHDETREKIQVGRLDGSFVCCEKRMYTVNTPSRRRWNAP